MTPAERLAKAFDECADRVTQAIADLRAAVESLVPELARAQLEAALANLAPQQPARRSPPKAIAPTRRNSKPAKAESGPKCRSCGRPGHNARTCGKQAAHEEEEEEEEEEDEPERPAEPRLPRIFARAAADDRPMTAIEPARPPQKMTPAELEAHKARIRERRAREEAREALRPMKPRPVEPEGPTPFVAALPEPIATFIF